MHFSEIFLRHLSILYSFKGVECAFPYEYSKEDLTNAKTDELEQVLINTDPGSPLGYAALVGHEDKFITSLEKSIEYCNALKCKRLHIMSGRLEDNITGIANIIFFMQPAIMF